MEPSVLEIVRCIRETPPRCASAFSVKIVEIPEETSDHLAWATFEVRCRNCYGSYFVLKGISTTWGEPPKHSEIGLSSICSNCGNLEQVFDMTTDGYDGEFGHYGFMRGSRERSELDGYDDAPVELRLSFVFNATADDLEQYARKSKKSPVDLFDAFNVTARRKNESDWFDLWLCECA